MNQIAQHKPVIWTKWKLKDPNSNVPCPRSGHTLTFCRSAYYLFGGTVNGLLDINIKRICATNELWVLEPTQKNTYSWSKQSPKGEIPSPRSNHIAVTIKETGANDSSALIFIHGGMNEKGKLDDSFLLDPTEMRFTKINTGENCPSPRANHAACSFDGKIYIFGGNGGRSYENQVFKDLWYFTFTTKKWEEIKSISEENPLPEYRAGHSIFIQNNCLYVYGGWNQSSLFNSVILLDLETNEWKTTGMTNEDLYIWNHCAVEVEAVPAWKYFVFGGSSTISFDEVKPRERANTINDVFVCDIDNKTKIHEVKLDDIGNKPAPREDSSMIYYRPLKSLLVFGGRNNEWLGDLYSLSVSSIVGPTYSVNSLHPNMGKISGGQRIKIHGSKLTAGSIYVYFITANKYKTVNALYISETEAELTTPNFNELGPREVEVRISIDVPDELSTNPIKFSIYEDTKADKTIFFGPGLIDGACPGVPTSFIIRARNKYNDNRTSGLDEFSVNIMDNVTKNPVNCEILDQNNGIYKVEFMAPTAGEYRISVALLEDNKTVNIRDSPIFVNFNGNDPKDNEILGPAMINKFLKEKVEFLEKSMNHLIDESSTKKKDLNDINSVINIKNSNKEIELNSDKYECKIYQLLEYYKLYDIDKKKTSITLDRINNLLDLHTNMNNVYDSSRTEMNPKIFEKIEEYKKLIKELNKVVATYNSDLKKKAFATNYAIGPDKAFEEIAVSENKIDEFQKTLDNYDSITKNLGIPDETISVAKSIEGLKADLSQVKFLWSFIGESLTTLEEFKNTKWPEIDGPSMDEKITQVIGKKFNQVRTKASTFKEILESFSRELNKWKKLMPLITALRTEVVKGRHWDEVRQLISYPELVVDENLYLKKFYELQIEAKSDEIGEITDKATEEDKMDKKLKEIKGNWVNMLYTEKDYARVTDFKLLDINEDNYAILEDNMQHVQSMSRNRFKAFFEKEIDKWKSDLNSINDVHTSLKDTQNKWTFLESLFLGSDEIKRELPEDTQKFVQIDKEVREILKKGNQVKNILNFSTSKFGEKSLLDWLKDLIKRLEECERSLNIFMDRKKQDFPRFYFISSVDLLDILSNGNNPMKINKHISKVILAIDKLELIEEKNDRPSVKGMHTRVGVEYVQFFADCKMIGKVENYLTLILNFMNQSLKYIAKQSIVDFHKMNQLEWIEKNPSQIALLTDLIVFVDRVESSLINLQNDPNSINKLAKIQEESLTSLIKTVMKNLTEETMAKVMVLIKLETHSRDVINEKLIGENVTSIEAFQWQSQLKAYWSKEKEDCHLNVCDAEFWYGYEYLGNGDRLVVTPLTDRIYVTATQALHLKLGCAPAGPAGTGKTETTKDLASAMGQACYVFNCSEQMRYKGMGEIFMGLGSSGTWGCFDEFNRLVPEVLSVCSTQFNSIIIGLKANSATFTLDDKTLNLIPSCGCFITMNPGYLGRSELPEGLKALFRPITVVVPDFKMISENCLMAQGFVEAKVLAEKFVVLYSLSLNLLSKQRHYDWGLRAIKSVLVVAGAFKRADPDIQEIQLLKRALRDFNVPKIVKDDMPIFSGLISDLFPNVNVERKRDLKFEAKILDACFAVNEKKQAKGIDEHQEPTFRLTPDENFVLKVVQLKELMEIRHSVFVMGNAGCGKTSTWRVLAKTFELNGQKSEAKDLNPKSITSDDLYGKYINIQTRDFKYGILSSIMKTMSASDRDWLRWIILDGDLDANWIENMNSVMDDNKVLTLPNNDRIDLLPNMRLIFEIRDLVYATPATVSRAGILYISDEDGYQYKAFIKSWIEQMKFRKPIENETNEYFKKFLEPCLNYLKVHVNDKGGFIVSKVFPITFVISLCKLLEAYIDRKEACISRNPKIATKADDEKYIGYDYIFCFSTLWACGAILTEKDTKDYRLDFNNWFKSEFKEFKFDKSIFSYYYDTASDRLEEWTKKIKLPEYKGENIKYVTVPTAETTAISELMENLLNVHHPSLLIGNAGCGKTQICKGMLENNRKKNENTANTFSYVIVNFNYYTDTYMMQNVIVNNTEKLMQRTFVPKNSPKLMAIFIDDLNMQMLDRCNTQNAIELIRQFMDYKHIYECSKMELMEFMNIQFVAAMNHTAGSFDINPRLQRHFWICSVPFPSKESLYAIYSFFLTGHFKSFHSSIIEFINNKILVSVSEVLHKTITGSTGFKKSAENFHYEFNLRHLTGVFQGILTSTVEKYNDPDKLFKMWVHECDRIYGDRLVTTSDYDKYRAILSDIVKNKTKFAPVCNKYFTEKNPEALIFCRFVNGHLDNCYDIGNIEDVRKKAEAALTEYNESGNVQMELVLFTDATKHICRISRIISQPSGHALLVGVGGSGKQSLSKLSAFICQYNIKMITISQEYKLNSLKEDLQKMFNATGLVDDAGLLFIFTEGQIVDEKFIVPINDLLSSGEIQDLYPPDDKEQIINKVRSACKSQTGKDSVNDVWNFFISRVKKSLHMSICFSPGENLRNKSRKFPAIVNTTVIDWFQPWPEDALYNVGKKKLEEISELASQEYFESVAQFMPHSFNVVSAKAQEMLIADRRYTYVTPKSFLELLKLFTSMYNKTVEAIYNQKGKLEAGLEKLKDAKETIGKLEIELQVQSVEIAQIRTEAEKNDKDATAKAIIVGGEAEIAEKTEKEVLQMKAKIEEESNACQAELNELLPLMQEAETACKKLEEDPTILEKMKSVMKNPPEKIKIVCKNLFIMMANQPGLDFPVEVDKSNFPKSTDNPAVCKFINDRKFKENLKMFSENIKIFKYNTKNFDNVIAKADPLFFDKTQYESNSVEYKKAMEANGALYKFVYNIYHYYNSAKTVEPMQRAVEEKRIQLEEAVEKLKEVQAKVRNLKEELEIVMKAKREAEEKLNDAVKRENACKEKLDLSKRFINALGSSNERWAINIQEYDLQLKQVIGDILIASAFVSYCGPFPKKYRDGIKTAFFNFVDQKGIPFSVNAKNPLTILTNDAQIASWNNQKLPADIVSIENGAILINSERWPLMIDPQLQGIKWIREKEKSNNLTIRRINAKNLMQTLGECIEDGKTMLIENLDNYIDATLAPVIARNVKKLGNTKVYSLGNNNHPINAKFKFMLHTKLSNPHYPPEIQAETTMINFTVTEDGLENQLLALIVKMERPLLAKKKEEVIQEQNQGKIKLKELEEGILSDLNTPGDLLENKALIVNLENSKEVSEKVSVSMKIAKEAEIEIDKSSNVYRPAAARGSLIFFLMCELFKLHTFYLYSLESYIFVIQRAVKSVQAKWKIILKIDDHAQEENNEDNNEEKKEEPVEEKEDEMNDNQRLQRVNDLTQALTDFSFSYVRRGLFERHKLIFSTLLSFRILLKDEKIKFEELRFLIEGKKDVSKGENNIPRDLLTSNQLASVKGLSKLDVFSNIIDILGASSEQNFWRKWLNEDAPEKSDLPKSMVHLTPFQKLLIIRALRPDRITSAITNYIIEMMTDKFIENVPFDLKATFSETNQFTPIFFVLFPGSDPTPFVVSLGKNFYNKIINDTLINISMGEGQEDIADNALIDCAEKGKWIFLQNVHLMTTWIKKFENNLEKVSLTSHPEFRCFISSEPPPLPDMQIIPEPIIQSCIKVANEAPQNLKANMKRAWGLFNDDQRFETSSKKSEFKCILFSLCVFHSLIIGRKKFGSIGWSRNYNFNEGDLTICADVLNNYLEKYEKIPWDDLRYIYGEIMYGGHITDNWDRRTNNAYLKYLIKPEILTGGNLLKNFKSPDQSRVVYSDYTKIIEDKLPIESPISFFLHPNAEISYLTAQGEYLFDCVLSIQGGSSSSSQSAQAKGDKKIDEVSESIKKFKEKLYEKPNFILEDLRKKYPNMGPYGVVALQECERMNTIYNYLKKKLEDLEKGKSGELSQTEEMDILEKCIKFNKLPPSWEETSGYMSKKSLNAWFDDVIRRYEQLEDWVKDLNDIPKYINLSLLCNPMSFVTAVKQVTARKENIPLDIVDIMTEVMNFGEDMVKDKPPSGVFVTGMFLQGARWEDSNPDSQGYLTEMNNKELDPKLPIMNIIALSSEDKKRRIRGYYECPVYYTTARGAAYVFTSYLKMESEEEDPNKWVLNGVALIISSDE